MKTEKEIIKKRDFIEMLLEESAEDIDMGSIQKRKLVIKLQILNWVLDKEIPDLKKEFMPLSNSQHLIEMFFKKNKGKWFSRMDISQKLKISSQSSQKYLRKLRSNDFLDCKQQYGQTGRPNVYKLK